MSRRSSSRKSASQSIVKWTGGSLSDAELELVNSLTAQQRLLVVQAAHELGNQDWQAVSVLLQGHPLTRNGVSGKQVKDVFAPDQCHDSFNALMKNAGLDPTPPQVPGSPALLETARKYYMERVHELHGLMRQEQEKFQACYAEVEEYRSGKLDYRLTDPAKAFEIDFGSSFSSRPIQTLGSETGEGAEGNAVLAAASKRLSPLPELQSVEQEAAEDW